MPNDPRRIFPTRPNASDPDSLAHKSVTAGTELIGYGKSNEGLRLTIHQANAPGTGDLQGPLTIHHVGWPNRHNARLPEVIGQKLTVAQIKKTLGLNRTMSFLRKYFLPLAALTATERDALNGQANINLDEDALLILDPSEPANENERKLKEHLRRERDSRVVREAKANYRASTERPVCQACEELFEDKYDMPYLEAHHQVPMAANNEPRQTTAADFDLLCANCHRAIHRMPAGSTLLDLRALLTRTGFLL